MWMVCLVAAIEPLCAGVDDPFALKCNQNADVATTTTPNDCTCLLWQSRMNFCVWRDGPCFFILMRTCCIRARVLDTTECRFHQREQLPEAGPLASEALVHSLQGPPQHRASQGCHLHAEPQQVRGEKVLHFAAQLVPLAPVRPVPPAHAHVGAPEVSSGNPSVIVVTITIELGTLAIVPCVAFVSTCVVLELGTPTIVP